MAAESGVSGVKEKMQALREEKVQVQEPRKREILRQRIRRLKRETRKLSREARLKAQALEAAEAKAAKDQVPVVKATAPAEPEVATAPKDEKANDN